MDVPSIKFRYFEKLKLWHDYLSSNAVFEKEKADYWRHEKMILHWAYSKKHQHLFTSLTKERILEFYGINGQKKLNASDLEEINTEIDTQAIRDDIFSNSGKIAYCMGNLVVENFFDCIEKVGRVPEKIRVNRRGLLIGEVLNEAYYKPNVKNKNFRKYKIGYWGLHFLIILALLSLVFLVANQVKDFFTDTCQEKFVSKHYCEFEK